MNLVGFYAGLNLIAWGMIFCFVRETKQLTLEEIDRKYHPTQLVWSSTDVRFSEVFSVPTKDFLHYETTIWLPYFIKRHIFRRNIIKPAPIIARGEKGEEVVVA